MSQLSVSRQLIVLWNPIFSIHSLKQTYFLPMADGPFLTIWEEYNHKCIEEERMNNMKNTRKIIISLAALVIVIAALLGIHHFTADSPTAGDKTITVEVVHKDGSVNSFTYQTDREFLGEVLADEALVEGETGAYGLFITSVDGETADDGNQEWWCITKSGEMLNTSADQTPIADKDQYELTLTVGY